ncbi:MAG: glycoside hydrolase family 25 protein, partial [Gaiellaceae bacterium]
MGVTNAGRRGRFALLAALVAVLVLAALPAQASAATARAKGIDVSHWNGVIDWIRVAGNGYTFVFGKATEGLTLIDPTYSVNRAGTEGFGLRFGAYHFARPAGSSVALRTANAIAQADHFVDVAQPQAGELPPVLDLEKTGGLAPASLQQWVQAWMNEVLARTGLHASVYSSPLFWKSAVANTASFATSGNRLWVAHWTKNKAPLVPAQNWGGQGWTWWQWTDCSLVPGFAHCSDGDRLNGSNAAAVTIPRYAAGAPAVATAPSVVGSAGSGKVLAALPGAWSGGKPVRFTYQWQRCDAAGQNCIPVDGAISEKYVPSAEDVGHSLVAAVTAT